MKKIATILLCIMLVFVLAFASSTALAHDDDPAGQRIANSPEEIRPLLIGMSVPDITGLTRTDGTPFDLNAAIAEKPTILIFYRGGW